LSTPFLGRGAEKVQSLLGVAQPALDSLLSPLPDVAAFRAPELQSEDAIELLAQLLEALEMGLDESSDVCLGSRSFLEESCLPEGEEGQC